jgi:hypothetical protein
MMKRSLMLLGSLLPCVVAAEELSCEPQVDSMGLFKNGLAVVRTSFVAKGPGVYRWEHPPRTVQGTFFVESAKPVIVRSTQRTVEAMETQLPPIGNLQVDLAGSVVRLTVEMTNQEEKQVIVGTVWKMPAPPTTPRVWNQNFTPDPYGFQSAHQASATTNPASTGAFLVLDVASDDGKSSVRRHVALDLIDAVEVLREAPRSVSTTKEVLLFEVSEPGPVQVSYLSKGASWVPSYFLDFSNDKQLRLRQTALVKNELMPLKETVVELISGFPNVKFGHVDSPLSQSTSLAGFFQQLSSSPRSGGAHAMMQNVAYQSRGAAGNSLPDLAEPGAASEDLHFESLGKQTLAVGDALSVPVAEGTAAYERVVEWTIADPRDAYGSYRNSSRGEEVDEDTQAWDAVIFANPLKFPMTTASITIQDQGKFRGQSQSNWTNPGQRCCVKVNRALSIQTDHAELEKPGSREQEVWMGGNRYYRTAVTGEAKIKNFRGVAATMLIRVQFSGNLLQADDKPTINLRREGVFSVNPRHEIEWKLDLKPNEEKTLKYEYNVLVRN